MARVERAQLLDADFQHLRPEHLDLARAEHAAHAARHLEGQPARDTKEEQPEAARGSDLPPASELVAEIEQFLKQQRPE